MPPATGPALIIIVAFLLPGFVTVLIQENTYRAAEDTPALDRLLRILYYSVWTYLLLAVAALILGIDRGYIEGLYEQNEGNPAELVWRGALVVLIPSLIIATVTRAWYGSKWQAWVIDKARINEHHLEPTGWDFFFRQAQGAYVRVTFKDGARVYGYYGNRSFAGYAKDGPDLFLECLFGERDDWFACEAKGTCGVWIKTQDAVSVEFYSPEDVGGKASSTETPEGNGPQTAAEGSASGTAA
jgi:hypothetical protein